MTTPLWILLILVVATVIVSAFASYCIALHKRIDTWTAKANDAMDTNEMYRRQCLGVADEQQYELPRPDVSPSVYMGVLS